MGKKSLLRDRIGEKGDGEETSKYPRFHGVSKINIIHPSSRYETGPKTTLSSQKKRREMDT